MSDKPLVLDKELSRPRYGKGAQTQADVMRQFDKAAAWCDDQQAKSKKENEAD